MYGHSFQIQAVTTGNEEVAGSLTHEHLEAEIVKPVEDIHKKERCRKDGASVPVNVVGIFHNKDCGCPTRGILHCGQAAALSC